MIYIGADHAGYKLKEQLKLLLNKEKIVYHDLGALNYNKDDDYPDYALKVAKKVVKEKKLGVLICGSGQGMCISANKVRGIRAGLAKDVQDAELLRKHNHANIVCLNGKSKMALKIIKSFLKTKPSLAQRHLRRIKKLE
jgi:ribose 5-phosphate isomerase B